MKGFLNNGFLKILYLKKMSKSPLILALPRGRVLEKILPLLDHTEFDLVDSPTKNRKILLDTKSPDLKIIIVRGWDVPTYVLAGAAHIGVVGKDILVEKYSKDYFEIADLDVAHCRLSLAGPQDLDRKLTRLKIATKYPNFSKNYLSTQGIQAETIYLNGAIEIAPSLGLSDAIIDLVDTGSTLRENGLVELEVIKQVSSRLIVNKAALKTNGIMIDNLKTILTLKQK